MTVEQQGLSVRVVGLVVLHRLVRIVHLSTYGTHTPSTQCKQTPQTDAAAVRCALIGVKTSPLQAVSWRPADSDLRLTISSER